MTARRRGQGSPFLRVAGAGIDVTFTCGVTLTISYSSTNSAFSTLQQ
jgi:hypothetical protein